MHTRVVQPKRGPVLFVRPLRHGDARTVMAVFQRLGDASGRVRFNGAKPCPSFDGLRPLATVARTPYVLVAHVGGAPEPVAIARLVREGARAEIAFAVADEHQERGIGSALAG